MHQKEAIVYCPFCDKRGIKIRYSPSRIERKTCRGSGMNKTMAIYTAEKYFVLNDCPECGAKAGKIQKFLNRGEKENTPPKREDVIRRLKESGLPTKI